MSEQKQQAQPAVAPTQVEPAIVSREKLLEAGTYFGHRVSQWNPKMKQYIWGKRMGIHIIDIAKTQKTLEYAYKLLIKWLKNNFIYLSRNKKTS